MHVFPPGRGLDDIEFDRTRTCTFSQTHNGFHLVFIVTHEAHDHLGSKPCVHQVSYTLGIRHDAGDQLAALDRIEVVDGQAHDVPMHLPPHLHDGALRGVV